jgi:hypothetical protein
MTSFCIIDIKLIRGPADLYLLEAMINPRWVPWSLISPDIYNFFARTTACEITRLAGNGPQEVLVFFRVIRYTT